MWEYLVWRAKPSNPALCHKLSSRDCFRAVQIASLNYLLPPRPVNMTHFRIVSVFEALKYQDFLKKMHKDFKDKEH